MKLREFACLAMLVFTVAASATTSAADSEIACDRNCLRGLVDQLLLAMSAHDAVTVPLAREYAATENGRPAALPMMTLWRTAGVARNRFYVIDTVSSQVFLLATVGEGGTDSLLFGRVRVAARRFSEIELYVDRGRGDGGFMFDANGLTNFPPAWTLAQPADRRASRAELLQAGRSIFDVRESSPTPSAECVLMENGRIVGEDPQVLKSLMGPKVDIDKLMHNADGTVAIPCGSPPERPQDVAARTDIADTEQGIVVSIGVVPGIVQPYLAKNPTESAYVPRAMLAPYLATLKQQRESGKFTAPALRAMPGSQLVSELYRIHSGKLQGMMMLQYSMPVGAGSPWVSSEAAGR
jgi:hypothetical protein